MRPLALGLAVALTLSGCGGPAQTERAPSSAGAAAVLETALTDVRTGERFTLGGFDGKVTFFIAMAVW